MEQINDYLGMGGYAAFVWPAYAISAVVLAVVFGVSWKALRGTEAELAKLQSSLRDDERDDAVPGDTGAPSLSPAAGDGR